MPRFPCVPLTLHMLNSTQLTCTTINNSHADVWFVLWLIRQWHGRRNNLLLLSVASSFADVARTVVAAAISVKRIAVNQGTNAKQRGNRSDVLTTQDASGGASAWLRPL